ncbi:Hypothetical predicted protein [Pelobates cultripes]|uniref:Uncharacterized protein n=1 Tax=Pelobates cultripes TaxID=61616 RepID=A0AAD1R0G4_PELCU|nr:Hypothetical predicted protein [Pelobates cultripes]
MWELEPGRDGRSPGSLAGIWLPPPRTGLHGQLLLHQSGPKNNHPAEDHRAALLKMAAARQPCAQPTRMIKLIAWETNQHHLTTITACPRDMSADYTGTNQGTG